MSFKPGDRVRWSTKDLEGTVTEDRCEDWPEFVPIQWSDGSRTFSAPTHIKAVKSGGALAKEHTTANETNTLIGADS